MKKKELAGQPVVPLATSTEVADHLRVPVGTLANWRYHGRGPRFIKQGNVVRYSWADVAAWQAEHSMQRTDGLAS